ncbi:MAG: IPT/TIG domain-containing protein [Planctomycetaceae bacterium]
MHSRARLLPVLLLAACSSGGGNDGVGAGTAVLQGSAFKGAFSSGTLAIHEFKLIKGLAALQSAALAAASFRATVAILGERTLLCEVTGTYREEALGADRTVSDFPLCAITHVRERERRDLFVHPVSSLVFWRVQHLVGLKSKLPLRRHIGLAEDEFGRLFGVGDMSVAPAATSGDALRLWALAAGISQMSVVDFNEPAEELLHLICIDGMDGCFDGFGCGRLLVFRSGRPFPPLILALWRSAMLAFLDTNPNNTTGIGSSHADVQRAFSAMTARPDGTLPPSLGVLGVFPACLPVSGGRVELMLDQDPMSATVLLEQNGVTRSTTASGSGMLGFDLPAAFQPGPVDITIRDAAGAVGLAEVELTATVASRVDSVSPPVVPQAGGACLQIRGRGFKRASPAVTVGGVSLTPDRFEVVSDELLLAYAPESASPGAAAVAVNGATLPNAFAYSDRGPGFTVPGIEGSFHLGTLTRREGSGPVRIRGALKTVDVAPSGNAASFGGEEFLYDTDDPMLRTGPVTGTVTKTRTADAVVLEEPSTSTEYLINAHDLNGPLGIGTGTVQSPLEAGFLFAARKSTSPPTLSGNYYLVGTSYAQNGQFEASSFWGTACFESGSVTVTGALWTRGEDGSARYAPILGRATTTVGSDGSLELGGFSPLAGFNVLKGFVDPGGCYGCLLGAGDGLLTMLVFAACPPGPVSLSGNYVGAGMEFEPVLGQFCAIRSALLLAFSEGLFNGLRCDIPFFFLKGFVLLGFENLLGVGLFTNCGGILFHKNGFFGGFVGKGGVLLHVPPLPFGAKGLLPGKIGFGFFLPIPILFSAFSASSPYKVLAMGMEVEEAEEPDPPTPSPFFRGTTLLGTAQPGVRGTLLICGKAFPLAGPFQFDTIKKKEVERDADRAVTTSLGGAASDSGFAFAFVANQLVAFPFPLPVQGTTCLLKGALFWDGGSAKLRSSEGFGSVWLAVLARSGPLRPPVDGSYNMKLFCQQFSGSDLFATVGRGSAAFAGAAGTHQLDYDQTSTREDRAAFPAGPISIPGTFTVDADGCVVLDNGTTELCGLVSPDGTLIGLMDPNDSPIDCLYLLTRRDGTTNPTFGEGPLCGVTLQFFGGGRYSIASRNGIFGLRATGGFAIARQAIHSNFTTAPDQVIHIFGGFATFPGQRRYDLDGSMEDLVGAVGSGLPYFAHAFVPTFGTPHGSLDLGFLLPD